MRTMLINRHAPTALPYVYVRCERFKCL